MEWPSCGRQNSRVFDSPLQATPFPPYLTFIISHVNYVVIIALVYNYFSIQSFLAANCGVLVGQVIILQGFKYYLCDHIGAVLSSRFFKSHVPVMYPAEKKQLSYDLIW